MKELAELLESLWTWCKASWLLYSLPSRDLKYTQYDPIVAKHDLYLLPGQRKAYLELKNTGKDNKALRELTERMEKFIDFTTGFEFDTEEDRINFINDQNEIKRYHTLAWMALKERLKKSEELIKYYEEDLKRERETKEKAEANSEQSLKIWKLISKTWNKLRREKRRRNALADACAYFKRG